MEDIVIGNKIVELSNLTSLELDFENNRSDVFVKEIYDKNPNFLLTFGYSNGKPRLFEFKNCVGKLMYYKRNVGKFEARNPFNRGRNYDGYIFKFKTRDFPKCIKDQNFYVSVFISNYFKYFNLYF